MDFVGRRLKQLLICPRQAMPVLLAEGSLGQAANVVFAAALLGMLSGWVYLGHHPEAIPEGSSLYAGLLQQFLRPFFTCLLWAAVSYAFACALGGKGKLRPLLMLFGYILVLDVLAYAYTLFRAGMELVMTEPATVLRWVDQALATGFWLWEVVLAVLAVRCAMHLSGGRAAVVVLVPMLILSAISYIFLSAVPGITG